MKRLLVVATLLSSCTRDAPTPPAEPKPAEPAAAPSPPAARSRDRAAAVAGPRPAPELTRAAFERFADARRKEVRRCYDAALAKEPALHGKITLQFAVLTSGAIDEVEVASTTFKSRTIPGCVAAVFRRWRTPFRPEEPVAIEYPLSFAPQR